jgi:argininosuccinate lyase
LGAENAIAAMKSYGSTAPEQVRKQIENWKIRIRTAKNST